MKYDLITKHKKYDENPFADRAVEGLKVRNKNVLMGKAGHLIIDERTGEIDGHTAFMKVKQVDPASFVKIYVTELQSLFNLSTNAIRVLSYIMSITKPNNDVIYFNMRNALVYTKYKAKVSVMKGLSQLIENQFIARADAPSTYFINPLVFFNGDRITFARHYIKKKTETEITEQLPLIGEDNG